MLSHLTQDNLSKDQWKEAEEAAASTKGREVWLDFDVNSRQRSRAVLTISDGLAKNMFPGGIRLFNVPGEMTKLMKRTVACVYVN